MSVRTIQRDIDALCYAGIPIISTTGSKGGYQIAERFQLDAQLASKQDYSYIQTALHGLLTATKDKEIQRTLEKISSISQESNSKILLNFSVLQEKDRKKIVVLYRWYSWYLLACSRARDDYRTYKIIRMIVQLKRPEKLLAGFDSRLSA